MNAGTISMQDLSRQRRLDVERLRVEDPRPDAGGVQVLLQGVPALRPDHVLVIDVGRVGRALQQPV